MSTMTTILTVHEDRTADPAAELHVHARALRALCRRVGGRLTLRAATHRIIEDGPIRVTGYDRRGRRVVMQGGARFIAQMLREMLPASEAQ